MIDLELLGNHIRELRHKKGLTQSEFAGILQEVVRPAYDAAQNSGFGKWVYQSGT